MPLPLDDFFRRITGQPMPLPGATMSGQPVAAPTPSAASVAAPTMAQLQQQDFNNAALQRMGQMGWLMMAAGQRMTPKERATILAQAPQYLDGMQTDMANAAQARLMNARAQQDQDELSRQAAINAKLTDPKFLAALNIKPEIAEAIGVDGIKKMLIDQMATNSPDAQLDRRYKQAQIDHLLAPPVKAEPTPQMVDLPGGGKGWAKPGSTEVVPIGGAGKGGADPEAAKRSDDEKKNLTYAKEAITAHRILSDPMYSGDLTSGYKSKVNMIPTLNGSWAGEKYLTGDAQANSFVDSVVRPRSGAVIGPKEEADKKRLFTPMPGDTQERLFGKAQMRAQHIQSLIAGANPADRPMLQQLYQDSLAELQKLATELQSQSSAPSAPALPPKVKSITPIN